MNLRRVIAGDDRTGVPSPSSGLSPISQKIRETHESIADRLCDHQRMGPRVLIVDDHPSFRRLATKVLEAGGFDVVGEAGDGEGALALAHRLRPQVVLLDVLLPDMSGFDVADALADDSSQVVLVSSRSAGDLAEGIRHSTARGFITKSELTPAALTALVGEAA
jgi:DNA-binding NarL/FixJ family response regulator